MKILHWVWVLVLLTACGPTKKKVLPPSTPHWVAVERITSAHLRGLHCVDDSVAWASGTEGTVMLLSDGIHWKDVSISTARGKDLRDVHGFDAQTAVAMSSGNGVAIYRTRDAGATWVPVYEDTNQSVFYDGIDFNANGLGVAYGDPIDGRMALLVSMDFGANWEAVVDSLRPPMDSNEAGYAASGTGIVVQEDRILVATGGGPKSRILVFDPSLNLVAQHLVPIETNPGSGIFSIAALSADNIIAVGGSYMDSTASSSNCAVTIDGNAWIPITVQNPRGYRSCIAVSRTGEYLISVGRTGSDYSTDAGLTWRSMGDEGYFTCDLYSKSGWAAGRNGKLARLEWK
ncbi:MAG: hypothetical protein RLP15_10810 [Cryomorphaceae bacterium]